MNKRKTLPLRLVALGCVLATSPLLINEYIKLSSNIRFSMIVVGLFLEITGLVLIKRQKKSQGSC